MNVKIGSAPDSWGVWFPSDSKQIPWTRFLDEVVQAGYQSIELGPYGYLPTDLGVLRSELSKRQLDVCAATVISNLEQPSAWSGLQKQVLGSGDLVATLGAKFLVLIDDPYSDLFTGKLIEPVRLDESSWKRMLDAVHRVADISRDRFGLTVVFHPHAETHVEYEDQIETFLEQTDPSRIFLCLDTGHHAYRGGDPIAFMRRHHARIPYLHLKSVDQELQRRVEAERVPFAIAVGMGIFCEPSKGAVNFPGFRHVLRDINYAGSAIVEQDMYPAPFDKPLPIARRTRTYLQEIGIG